MGNKLIAIAFSDLHINLWGKFNKDNKRTLDNFRVLFVIRDICKAKKIPALFCGDMFNKGEVVENELFDLITSNLIMDDWDCYAISGNHCFSKTNSTTTHSPSFLKSFSRVLPWLHCIDWQSKTLYSKDKKPLVKIHGVPYIDHNKGLSEYIKSIKLDDDIPNILMLHTDYPGARDTDGRKIDSVENLNLNSLKGFNLVLCGHIHKPQRLSKKVYMVGAPIQMRRTDMGCELGYWEIYSDMSVKFKSLDGFPKFIDVESSEDIKDDGNYYTVIPKKEEKQVKQDNKIHKSLTKDGLARKYMRAKGIKDKKKLKLLKEVLKKAENHD